MESGEARGKTKSMVKEGSKSESKYSKKTEKKEFKSPRNGLREDEDVDALGSTKFKKKVDSKINLTQQQKQPKQAFIPGSLGGSKNNSEVKHKLNVNESIDGGIGKRLKSRKRSDTGQNSSYQTSQMEKREAVGIGEKEQILADEKEEFLRDRESVIGTEVEVPEDVNLLRLSKILKIELSELLEKALAYADEVGVTIVDEFQPLRRNMIDLLCSEYKVSHTIQEKGTKQLLKRPPIVTIMGHVDHGKTTLLDAFRNSNLVDQEFGAITQSTAAFSFETESGHFITFIDTPGHEVFDGMRIRGAKATDIVIVVISAVEGIQKQTLEVLNLVKKYELPMVVAINKVDREFADPDKVMLDLINEGIEVDELGGDVPCAQISALTKLGLDVLEEKLITLAEELELKAPHDCDTECLIVESNYDEESSQNTACVVVRKGVLSVGDTFICGMSEGKVKFILGDKGE